MQKLTDADFEHANQASYDLSLQYKRQNEWDEAVQIWEKLFKSSDVHLALKAGIELAKCKEHRQKMQGQLYPSLNRYYLSHR